MTLSCVQNKSFQLTFVTDSFFLIFFFSLHSIARQWWWWLNWITMGIYRIGWWWSRNEGNARNEQIELLRDFFFFFIHSTSLPTWSCFYCHFHSSMLTSILHKWIYEFYIAVYYTNGEKEEFVSRECGIVMALNMLWIISAQHEVCIYTISLPTNHLLY